MRKMEDKANLTWWDFIIHQKEIKQEMENDSRLLDENQLYLSKLETTIQQKNAKISLLEDDYKKIKDLYALKDIDLCRVNQQLNKTNKQLEKARKTLDKQRKTINELNVSLSNKNEEIEVLNDRLEYCRSHRRAPDLEEIKAYELNKKEVLKKIREKK